MSLKIGEKTKLDRPNLLKIRLIFQAHSMFIFNQLIKSN